MDAVVALVDDLLDRAFRAGASDVHFDPQPAASASALRVRFRVDALLHEVELLPPAITPNVIARLKVLAGLLTYRVDVPQEGAIPAGAQCPGDVRVATFPTLHGERVVLRLLPAAMEIRGLDELGHAPELVARLRALLELPQGLLIVCGPAGSGKSTTLHALLAHLSQVRQGASILTLEDPVEIRHAGITQIEVAPHRGLTYATALRSLLRQDPEILMVGEVRDAETAHLVIDAALTGHLLLTTLHSGSPAEALTRLREMGVAPYQLTSTVAAVLSQRLLRTVCRTCGGTGVTERDNGRCTGCLGSCYAGRMAIGELAEVTSDVRSALLAGGDAEMLATAFATAPSLHSDAGRLLQMGRTTTAEVERVLGVLKGRALEPDGCA